MHIFFLTNITSVTDVIQRSCKAVHCVYFVYFINVCHRLWPKSCLRLYPWRHLLWWHTANGGGCLNVCMCDSVCKVLSNVGSNIDIWILSGVSLLTETCCFCCWCCWWWQHWHVCMCYSHFYAHLSLCILIFHVACEWMSHSQATCTHNGNNTSAFRELWQKNAWVYRKLCLHLVIMEITTNLVLHGT